MHPLLASTVKCRIALLTLRSGRQQRDMRAGPAYDDASCGGYCIGSGTSCCYDSDYSSGLVPCCNTGAG